MKIKGKEININKKILIVVGIIVLVGIGFIGKGKNEEKRIIDNSVKAIEAGDYEYARTALASVVDGSNSKKIDKLWNIVTCYQNATDQLYSYNNIEKAKEYLDKMDSDYKKYDKLKADVDKVKEEVKSREDYIKEVDKIIEEVEKLMEVKEWDSYKKAQEMANIDKLKYYSELPERQRKRLDELYGEINDGLSEIRNEINKKEEALREENNKKAEELEAQQGTEPRYFVPHLNKRLTMEEMQEEYNKTSTPFDYIGDAGMTYMFNPGSAKPTEPAY
jgi:hypothetical protein